MASGKKPGRARSVVLTGPGAVTVDDSLAWTGGAMSGAGLTLSSGAGSVGGGSPFGPTLSGRTLENAGTFTVGDGSNLLFSAKAAFDNDAGATLVLGNGSSLGNFFGNSGQLNNAGLIEDTGPTSQATIDLSSAVTNGGTISLQGVLNVSGSGGCTQTAAGILTIVLGPGAPVTNGDRSWPRSRGRCAAPTPRRWRCGSSASSTRPQGRNPPAVTAAAGEPPAIFSGVMGGGFAALALVFQAIARLFCPQSGSY